MGRDDRTSTCIRLPPDLHAQLVEAAAERDVSINWLVVHAIADFLPRLIPASEFRLTRPPSTDVPQEEKDGE